MLGVAALALRGACGSERLAPRQWNRTLRNFPPQAVSAKGIVSRIDGQCPNAFTDRNEAAANVSPRSTVICRLERRRQPVAKTSPIESNVTALASNALKPLFCSVHESPLSVDRNMPPPSRMIEQVAAKMWPLLLIRSPAMSVDVWPGFASIQPSPLSVER